MKGVYILIIIALSSHYYFAQVQCSHKKHQSKQVKSSATPNLRSDTIDILNYTVSLDITDYTNQTIAGFCDIDFVALKNNVTTLSLDLLKLTVDSIVANSQQLSFTHNDTLLVIQLANTLNINDTSSLSVFYHGVPQKDPSGFGGWYFSGNYSYNMGAAFQDTPHNYGRVWHPCFDNFVERATYTYHIKTDSSKSVHCNGLLTNETTTGAIKTTTWELNQPIPSYLAGIAVGNYAAVQQTYNSTLTSTTIPIYLSAQASDTVNLKNSFVNLDGALSAFESSFGPYFWDKVGYSLVPFNGGAMEHATNIAYPNYAADGSLNYEFLMAHELAHHWWGNLVTCRTAEDMWINEGMSSFSERLFLEHVYGYPSYINSIRENHKDVLHTTHIIDEGFRALHGIPHEFTYGEHTYNKGADVAHTLRGYMGDAEFFSTLTAFLAANKYKDVDAYDFRDFITANSSFDATDFFNDWIFNPGFPQFSIDSVKTVPSGTSFLNTVYVKQKRRAAPNYFSNVPLEVTFKNINWDEETFDFIMNGSNAAFQFTTSFAPKLSFLNGADKISQAVTAETQVISSTGVKNFSYAFFKTTVSNISDSAYLKVEHNWVAPDDFKDGSKGFQYEISTERYWNVTGFLPATFDAKIQLLYNGRSTPNGNLDNLLTSSAGFNEDSLVLLHRNNPSEEWEVVTNCTFNSLGSKIDGYGRVDTDSFKLGQYTFGWKRGTVDVNEKESSLLGLAVYPTLATNFITVSTTNNNLKNLKLTVVDLSGKQLYSAAGTDQQTIDIENWSSGTYIVVLSDSKGLVTQKEFIKL